MGAWGLTKVVIIILSLALTSQAAVLLKRNTTVTLPEGITYHKDAELICTPAGWTDILSFFLGNYGAHAATLITLPGDSTLAGIVNIVAALFFPNTGVNRGLRTIFRRAVFWKDPLQQAHRAGALCMVVRSRQWQPEPGEKLRSLSYMPHTLGRDVKKLPEALRRYGWVDRLHSSYMSYLCRSSNSVINKPGSFYRKIYLFPFKTESYIRRLHNHRGYLDVRVDTPPWMLLKNSVLSSGRHYLLSKRTAIFGGYSLPSGYEFTQVPPHACVEPPENSNESKNSIIQPSYSASAAIIAVFQALYAVSTLYQSRGYQVHQYGYAAFGFTVLPYLAMSIVNLIGNLVTPTYPCMYIVKTEIMDEAITRGGTFDTIVGTLESDPLTVDERGLFVFNGSFDDRRDGQWNFRLNSKVYKSGDMEPLEELQDIQQGSNTGSADSVAIQSNDKIAKDSPHPDTSSEDERLQYSPVIIVPSCYNFKFRPPKPPVRINLYVISFSWLPKASAVSCLHIMIGLCPLIAIGAMSHFKAGSSTVPQRVWIMLWLAVNASVNNDVSEEEDIASFLIDSSIRMREHLQGDHDQHHTSHRGLPASPWQILFRSLWMIFRHGVEWAVSIGRLVIVGQMLHAYGTCTSLE